MNISHEVLSRDDAYEIANLDSRLHSGEGIYASSNALTYYIAINTWYYQVCDCDKWAAASLLRDIKFRGLLAVIKDCDTDATRLVQGDEPKSDIGALLYQVARNKTYFGLASDKNAYRDDLATALQLLRYLKRFSPSNNHWIQEEGIQSFIQNENIVKLRQRREYPYWLIKAVRDEITKVVDWDKFCKKFDSMTPYDFCIPTGATYEGYKTIGEKIVALAASYPEMFYQPFGLPVVYPYYLNDQDKDESRVQAVPKSYKASRIIAMEPLWRQARSGYVALILQRLLPYELDVTDQGRNQSLAQEGSRLDNLATLDASNASDLISKTLFRSVFPSAVVRRLDPLFSHYTNIKGRRRPMQMMSTAGHSLTFILETLVYYGIAKAAATFYDTFTGSSSFVSVYGDDVVLSSGAAATAIEFYGLLGLKINVDKSYLSGPYRESCGEEYWNGINVSSTYYPRFPVVGTCTSKSINLGVRMYRDSYRGKIDDSTTMLVDLQKRLFGVSYDSSLFLWNVLTSCRRKLTSSKAGSICNDLWAATDIAISDNPADRMREKGYDIPDSVVSLCDTQKHSYASLQYRLPPKFSLSRSDQAAIDIYKYQLFLKTGPTFSTELDRLLGVSEPPTSLSSLFGEGRLIWKYSIR